MIETDRLILRAGQPSDLAALHEIFTDPDVMQYWSRPPHTKIAETKAFLDHFIDPKLTNRCEFMIEFEGRCVGKAGCWMDTELGFILHPSAWGQGIAFEACSAILPLCFEQFQDAKYLTANADPRNLRSTALLQKLGFELDRIGKADFLYGESEWCDTAYYKLPRP